MRYNPRQVRASIAKQLRAQLDPKLYHIVSGASILLTVQGDSIVLDDGIAVYRRYTQDACASYPLFVADVWDSGRPLDSIAATANAFMRATMTEILFADVLRHYYMVKGLDGMAKSFSTVQKLELASVPAKLSFSEFVQRGNKTPGAELHVKDKACGEA